MTATAVSRPDEDQQQPAEADLATSRVIKIFGKPPTAQIGAYFGCEVTPSFQLQLFTLLRLDVPNMKLVLATLTSAGYTR